MKDTTIGFFVFVVLGFASLVFHFDRNTFDSPPLRVVCESGTFVPSSEPYTLETAICTLNDANGRPVEVRIID